MKDDIKSNFQMIAVIGAQTLAASTVHSLSVDHSLAPSVSFIGSVGAITGTVNAKTQYSNDGVTWLDYPSQDVAKNDSSIAEITASGTFELHVPNPYVNGRYTRLEVTVGGTDAEICVVAVLGPLRHVAA